jgi:saccharopine dehydrogenase (NAD+, L-lysine forming)
MQIGVLKETKIPVDRRVSLTPEQIRQLIDKYPKHQFLVQSSVDRAFTDKEYQALGIEVVDEIADCDILLGIKEISLENLIPGKTFLLFSHTAKKQPYNQKLLKRSAELGITLIDYEYLKKDSLRVIAFGYWAGIVGAYNALLGYGKLIRSYELKPAHKCHDLHEVKAELNKVSLIDPVRIVLTGEGRVASGAIEILEETGVIRIDPELFLKGNGENVYCQIGPQHYTKHKKDQAFDFNVFIKHPEDYYSTFFPYATKANVFIACHYWDNRSPVFLTHKEMSDPEFGIKLIADISCDVNGPIPSTIRASSIESPFYGFDILKDKEVKAFLNNALTVMAVDNLPGELPRNSSYDFGEKLVNIVLPELLTGKRSEMIEGATILKNGKLTDGFAYLNDCLYG